MGIDFQVNCSDGYARRGVITTAHGVINTPAFMPVGTCANIKGMLPQDFIKTGSEILLCNTYHLMLRPSEDVVAEHGGLHEFMNWHKPILTDSGGFQVMSLSRLCKVKEYGVEFRSHIDGSKQILTPEKAMDIQYKLDSNISMVLDECTKPDSNYESTKKAVELSVRWAKRSKEAFKSRKGYALFSITQGAVYKDLRQKCIEDLLDIGFDGYAVGGCVGSGEKLFDVLDFVKDFLPYENPRYVMGIGEPLDIIGAVYRGFDMFDCILPTRSGRYGYAYTRNGKIKIQMNKYRLDKGSLDPECQCPACTQFSKGYINHLFRAKEILGGILLTWHNIQFYQDMMSGLRQNIENNNLHNFATDFLKRFYQKDIKI